MQHIRLTRICRVMHVPPLRVAFRTENSMFMQRSDIRTSIDFRGLIRGCPDHQWLIADAIWETQSGVGRERWVITTEEGIVRHSTGTEQSPRIVRRTSIVAHDRWTGWTAHGSSPADIAAQIRRVYG